jgi:hypothetical protein
MKALSTHDIRGLLEPRDSLDAMEESTYVPLPGIEYRFPGGPAHSLVSVLIELLGLLKHR